MTAYELADLAMNAQNTVPAVFALFLSIASGYLILAKLAGGSLTKLQVSIVNLVFVTSQLLLISGWLTRWNMYVHFQELASQKSHEIPPPDSMLTLVVGAIVLIFIITIIGSLLYMASVRRSHNS